MSFKFFEKLKFVYGTSNKKLILLAVFIISAVPRFALLSAGPFHYDTLDYVIAGKKTLETGSLHYAHGVGYPFTVVLSAFFQLILGCFSVDEVGTILIATAVGASLAVVAFFMFVESLFKNKKVAFFSSLAFSFFPPFFSVTTYGRLDHAFSLFFVALSFYFLLKHLDTKDGKYLIFSSISFGLGVCTRFSVIWIIFPYIFTYLYFNLKIRRNKLIIIKNAYTVDKLTFLIFPAMFVVIALYLPMLLNSGLSRFVYVISNPYQAKWMGIFTPLLRLSFSWLVKSFTYFGIILIIFGMYLTFKEKRYSICAFSLLWVLVLMLYFGNLSSVSPRFLILPSLPLFFILGFSVYKIDHFSRHLGLFTIAALIILMIYPIYPILKFRHTHNMQKEFAMYLKNITDENAIILAQDESIFLRYYLKDTRTIVNPPVTCNETEMQKFFEKVNTWLDRNRSVYIIETGFAYDPCKLFLNTLFRNYTVVLVGKHLNEDWHHKSIFSGVFEERVFRIERKY